MKVSKAIILAAGLRRYIINLADEVATSEQ